MKRILIISTSFDEQQMIEEVLKIENNQDFEITTTASFGQDTTYWLTRAPDLLIINMPADDILQGYFLTKLKNDVPKEQVMIIACPSMTSAMMNLSTHFARVRLLKSPVQGFDLYRTILDLTIEYGEGRQQVHPRYLTNQEVSILSDFKEGNAQGYMKNLSLSGAFIELTQDSLNLSTGDVLKMSISIGQPARQYIFDARVVWIRPQSDSSRIGMGVAFVDRNQVYDNLFKNI